MPLVLARKSHTPRSSRREERERARGGLVRSTERATLPCARSSSPWVRDTGPLLRPTKHARGGLVRSTERATLPCARSSSPWVRDTGPLLRPTKHARGGLLRSALIAALVIGFSVASG